MEAPKQGFFDPYEFTAIVVPGAMLLIALLAIHPLGNIALKDFTLGEFGVFAVASFCAGHVIQAFGNIFETVYWSLRGGMPTTRAFSDRRLLSAPVFMSIVQILKGDGVCEENITKEQWTANVRLIIARVGSQQMQRLERFNASYGLLRGMTVSGLGAVVYAAFNEQWVPAAIFLVLSGVLCYRMERFATHYARELFHRFRCCNASLSPVSADGAPADLKTA